MYLARGWIRRYHSKHMRSHQSAVARLDNIFKPLEPLFEDETPPIAPNSGSYAAKRMEEKLTRPLPSISRYIEACQLGSPRTARDFRSIVNKKRMAVRFLDQLKPKAKFIASAIEESQLPLANLPEIAVIGRSNSGKSTLINAIVGTRCCSVDNKPGSTKHLNFYRIGDPPLLTFVDVPGFGFAYAASQTRTQWTEFALWYLRSRRNLRLAILVADARHGLADSDLELISFLKSNKISFKIALNKCDLVHAGDLAKRLTVLGNDLSVSDSQLLDKIVPVSALRDLGMERLRSLVEPLKMKRDVIVAGQKKIVMDLLEERRLKKAQLRAERKVRKTSRMVDLFGSDELVTDDKTKSTNDEFTSEEETEAYKPDATSILKRREETSQDVTILRFENFVSNDEIENLGLRGGSKRADIPSPTMDESNTNYELKMRVDHALEWKNRLELATFDDCTVEVKSRTTISDTPQNEELSALGFITTDTHTEMPKGIRKWKVVGMKPVGKVSRAKNKPDLIYQISNQNRKRKK